ncbi:globin domain-containing protein, partial [Streptomyces flavofungini]|uniref:globin domain-containing protein n=1 Tax=Streptomyces flavofungini TaxID=68200 RepID=UPI0034DFF4CF
MLNRIAHKHASLGVAPGQYETVRLHLFAALAETLGDAVTAETAAAWDEVYWLMANALIAIEARLYAGHGATAAEGTWRDHEVVERVEETPDVVTFRLRPVDGAGAPVPRHRAGQYVSVQVELDDGARQIRQYSLTGAAGGVDRLICVKRVRGEDGSPEGEVSRQLHARVRAGSVVRVSAPYGDLVLGDVDPGAPLLLASAGIGVTPMIALLGQLADAGHRGPVTALHADRSPAEHA